MMSFDVIIVPGYEQVVEAKDAQSGLHCFVAIHSTVLGPALGGIRMRPYESRKAALQDGLNLSKAMTHKSAAAGLALGGGKCVVIGDPDTQKTESLLFALAEVLNRLKGSFIGAGDMGMTPADMSVIKKHSPYVAGTDGEDSSGDPSSMTAFGVFQSMRAAANALWNNPSLKGKTIAIQGIGKVSRTLIQMLFWEGAHLIIGTRDVQNASAYKKKYQAQLVPSEDILAVECDLLSPCAIGGIVNDQSVPLLHCKGIVGAANNQLSHPEISSQLAARQILYAPDFIVNAGGVINLSTELLPGGYQSRAARDKTEGIFQVLTKVFQRAKMENRPTTEIATTLAEENLKKFGSSS